MTVEYLGSMQAHVWEIVKENPGITIPEILALEGLTNNERYGHYHAALTKMEKFDYVERVTPRTRPVRWRVVG